MTAVSYNKDEHAFAVWNVVMLLISSLGGIGLGMHLFWTHSYLFSAWMYAVAGQPLSIVGVLFSSFFPLLICKLALVTKAPVILSCLCFLKSLGYGFAAMGISFVWGSAGWLVRCLFLFTDRIVLIALIHIALMQLCGRRSLRLFPGYCFLIFITLLVDKWIISDFLQDILFF